MIGRVIFVILINVALAVAFIWYMPIAPILEERGFTEQQIETLLAARTADREAKKAAELGFAPTGPVIPAGAPKSETQDRSQAEPGPQAQPPTSAPVPVPADRPPPAAPAAPSRQIQTQPDRVATADVNIRTGQGTDNEAIGQVPEGTVVTLLGDPGGEWIRIRYQGVEGWVYAPLFEAQ